jgi:hypothetical protein
MVFYRNTWSDVKVTSCHPLDFLNYGDGKRQRDCMTGNRKTSLQITVCGYSWGLKTSIVREILTQWHLSVHRRSETAPDSKINAILRETRRCVLKWIVVHLLPQPALISRYFYSLTACLGVSCVDRFKPLGSTVRETAKFKRVPEGVLHSIDRRKWV